MFNDDLHVERLHLLDQTKNFVLIQKFVPQYKLSYYK